MTLVIPARGGSKRIPGKNIRPFLGAPILTYPIRVALESGVFSAIVVSTDDAAIAEVAEGAGAKVLARGAAAASDTASVEDVCQEVLERLDETGPFAVTFPTSVFTRPEHWLEAVAGLGPEVECVYSGVAYDHPPWRARRTLPSIAPTPWHFPLFSNSRTQDCPPAHHDAGQFYVCSRWAPSILDLPSVPIMLPRNECWDIDEPEDWGIAEALYTQMIAGPFVGDVPLPKGMDRLTRPRSPEG